MTIGSRRTLWASSRPNSHVIVPWCPYYSGQAVNNSPPGTRSLASHTPATYDAKRPSVERTLACSAVIIATVCRMSNQFSWRRPATKIPQQRHHYTTIAKPIARSLAWRMIVCAGGSDHTIDIYSKCLWVMPIVYLPKNPPLIRNPR